jgi:P27 family predicted phage terminase small subunit
MDNEIVKVAKGRLAGVLKVAPASVFEPGRPKYPRDISATGKRIFKRLCKRLEERRTLTSGDEEILKLYVFYSDQHAEALAHLQSEGTVIQTEKGPLVSPYLAIAERMAAKMISILDRLGLTPASRDRVKTTRRTLEPNTLEILLTPEPPKEGGAGPEKPDTSKGEVNGVNGHGTNTYNAFKR